MDVTEKICPSCHVEYRPTAEICSDCNVRLLFAHELAPEDDEAELPPASEMLAIRIAGVMWCRAFSAALAEAGISHRIDAPPESGEVSRRSHDQDLAIFVKHEDREAAMALDAEFVRAQVPDSPGEAEAAGADDTCPACGDPLTPSAVECPGCGLFMGEPG